MWLLLKAEFLAITLVLVYLGAVMVLFLFVVMMLDIRFDTVRRGFWKHFPLAAFIGALVAFEMAAVLMTGFRGVEEPKAVPALVNAAGRPAVLQHPGAGQADVHRVPVPRGDRCGDPAGGHDLGDCPDAAPAQGRQGRRCHGAVVRAGRRPHGGAEDACHAGTPTPADDDAGAQEKKA